MLGATRGGDAASQLMDGFLPCALLPDQQPRLKFDCFMHPAHARFPAQARPHLGPPREKFDGEIVTANVSSLKLLTGKFHDGFVFMPRTGLLCSIP
jgi:hypothetical protein